MKGYAKCCLTIRSDGKNEPAASGADHVHLQGGLEHPMPELPPGRAYNVVNTTNQGREGDSFAGHLVR